MRLFRPGINDSIVQTVFPPFWFLGGVFWGGVSDQLEVVCVREHHRSTTAQHSERI